MALGDTITNNSNDSKNNNNGVSRRDIQAAINAKAVELRALHAALCHTSSPNKYLINKNINRRYPSSSCASPVSGFTAQDYPVFTPSYGDEPLPANHHKNPKLSESWDECTVMEAEEEEKAGKVLSDCYKTSASRKTTPVQRSPQEEIYTSSRRNNSLSDFRPVASCNRCKSAVVTGGFDSKSTKNNHIVVPWTDSRSSILSSQPRNRGVISRLFPRFKKKNKNNVNYNISPKRTDKSVEVSQVLKDSGVMTVDKLKRDLVEANRSRDAALMEVSAVKSSLGELSQKLEYLENYCEGLKRALKQTASSRENCSSENPGNFPRKWKISENPTMPVTDEAMVEGFLQIVSESRLSVKQFLKTLVSLIDENEANLNYLLQPYNLASSSRHSKTVQCHLEAIINQSLYQDFENCVFQKNGTPNFLDPEQDRQAQFSSFVSLRNLSWNEVLKKGTKYYSKEFSTFCDQKMGSIITTLNWTGSWSEQLLQAFFVAAKCIWLLHLLAFSFNPALGILRVEENRTFDSNYMEDMIGDRQRLGAGGPVRVRVMVMPGFYVHDRVLKCKVLCRYR